MSVDKKLCALRSIQIKITFPDFNSAELDDHNRVFINANPFVAFHVYPAPVGFLSVIDILQFPAFFGRQLSVSKPPNTISISPQKGIAATRYPASGKDAT